MRFKTEGFGAPFWIEASEQAAAADTVQAILTDVVGSTVYVAYDVEAPDGVAAHPYVVIRSGSDEERRITIRRDEGGR